MRLGNPEYSRAPGCMTVLITPSSEGTAPKSMAVSMVKFSHDETCDRRNNLGLGNVPSHFFSQNQSFGE